MVSNIKFGCSKRKNWHSMTESPMWMLWILTFSTAIKSSYTGGISTILIWKSEKNKNQLIIFDYKPNETKEKKYKQQADEAPSINKEKLSLPK